MLTPVAHPPRRLPAFTLIEVLIIGALLVSLGALGLRSMFFFTEQRKLRLAAVELSGYLQTARAVASAENFRCIIALSNTDGGVFTHSASANDLGCKPGALLPAVRLGGLAGSRDLQVTVTRGSFPLTFTPEGTIATGATVRLSSSNVPEGAWCVDVQAPLATVRIGWQQGQAPCDYVNEQ